MHLQWHFELEKGSVLNWHENAIKGQIVVHLKSYPLLFSSWHLWNFNCSLSKRGDTWRRQLNATGSNMVQQRKRPLLNCISKLHMHGKTWMQSASAPPRSQCLFSWEFSILQEWLMFYTRMTMATLILKPRLRNLWPRCL